MLSTGGSPDTAAKCMKLGALDFLQSPISVELLTNRIRYYLDHLYYKNRLRKLKQEVDNFVKDEMEISTLLKQLNIDENLPQTQIIGELAKEIEVLRKHNATLKYELFSKQQAIKEVQKKEQDKEAELRYVKRMKE